MELRITKIDKKKEHSDENVNHVLNLEVEENINESKQKDAANFKEEIKHLADINKGNSLF